MFANTMMVGLMLAPTVASAARLVRPSAYKAPLPSAFVSHSGDVFQKTSNGIGTATAELAPTRAIAVASKSLPSVASSSRR